MMQRQINPADAEPLLDLWDTGGKLENIAVDVDEATALIFTASRDDQLDPETRSALRAIGRIVGRIGSDIVDLSEKVYAASKADRGDNVTDFLHRSDEG